MFSPLQVFASPGTWVVIKHSVLSASQQGPKFSPLSENPQVLPFLLHDSLGTTTPLVVFNQTRLNTFM